MNHAEYPNSKPLIPFKGKANAVDELVVFQEAQTLPFLLSKMMTWSHYSFQQLLIAGRLLRPRCSSMRVTLPRPVGSAGMKTSVEEPRSSLAPDATKGSSEIG